MTGRDAILPARCWNGPAARPGRSRIVRLSRLLPLAATAHGAQAASTGAGVTSSACVMQRDMVASSTKSAVVAGLSAVGPLAVIGTIGLRVLPIAVATGLGGVGWPFGGPR